MLSASIEAPASVILRDCSAAELADAEGLARRWLTKTESASWERFPTEKRRRDWLGGRVAAKRALGRLLGLSDFEAARLTVENDGAGAPLALRAARRLAEGLSISHCALGAVAAAVPAGRPVGCDWEPVAPLPERVIELFAHETERAALSDAAAVTRLWTRKEAVLKLLGLGLGIDPRAVRFAAEARRPALFDAARARWQALGTPRISTYETSRDGASLAVAFVDA